VCGQGVHEQVVRGQGVCVNKLYVSKVCVCVSKLCVSKLCV